MINSPSGFIVSLCPFILLACFSFYLLTISVSIALLVDSFHLSLEFKTRSRFSF